MLLTTVNAALQRVPSNDAVAAASLHAEPGDEFNMQTLTDFLASNGYNRSGQVMEHGEFAVRGGLLDLFPPGYAEPLRLDFFGDELDTIRTFDPLDQRTTGKIQALDLKPASEYALSKEAITRFRKTTWPHLALPGLMTFYTKA